MIHRFGTLIYGPFNSVVLIELLLCLVIEIHCTIDTTDANQDLADPYLLGNWRSHKTSNSGVILYSNFPYLTDWSKQYMAQYHVNAGLLKNASHILAASGCSSDFECIHRNFTLSWKSQSLLIHSFWLILRFEFKDDIRKNIYNRLYMDMATVRVWINCHKVKRCSS